MNKTLMMSLGVMVSFALGEMRLTALLILVALAGTLADSFLSESTRKAIREPASLLMTAFRHVRKAPDIS
jgi:hypothetical protein